MKLINELTPFKILMERNGLLVSITTKRRAYFLFLSSKFIGIKIGPTTDPYPGIVEICNYEIESILRNWDRLGNLKLPLMKYQYAVSGYSEIVEDITRKKFRR